MKCVVCGGDTHVISTRKHIGNTLLRRRQCIARGHRFSTVEIADSAFNNVKQRVMAYHAAMLARIARWQRNQAIVEDPRSSREVSRDHGMNDSNVRQIRRTHL